MENTIYSNINRDVLLLETFRFDPSSGFQNLALHLERLEKSAKTLGFKFDNIKIDALLSKISAPQALRCRLALSREGDIDLQTTPIGQNPSHWRVAIFPTRLRSDDPWLRIKSTRRALYEEARAALPQGIDEWLFLNERDELCEGTITKVFLHFEGDIWHTPHASCGCLPGVLRQKLLNNGNATEKVIPITAVQNYRQISFGNSLRGQIVAELVTLAT